LYDTQIDKIRRAWYSLDRSSTKYIENIFYYIHMGPNNTLLINPETGRQTDLSDPLIQRFIFFGILVTGILLRILRLLRTAVISPDGPGYIHDALRIGTEGLRGPFEGGFGGNFSIYPFFLYSVNLLIGDPVVSGQMVSLFFGSLLIVSIYFLVKKTFGQRAGLYAAFLASIHPHLIRYSVDVLKDSMLFFFAVTAFVLALMGHEKRNYVVIFLAGVLAWTAGLVRVYGTVVVLSISVAIIVAGLADRLKWRAIAGELLLFAIPVPIVGYLLFVLCIGADAEYITHTLVNLFLTITERFSAADSYRDILMANSPGVDRHYLDMITSFPWLAAFRGFIDVWVSAFSGLFWALFLIGIYFDRKSLIKERPALFVMTCAVVLTLIDIIIFKTLFFLSKRHVMVMVILLLPWSAMALDRIIGWYKERIFPKYRIRRVSFNTVLWISFLVSVILGVLFTSFLDPEIDKRLYKKTAGEYIKGLGQANPMLLVLQTDTLVTFYSGGTEVVANKDVPLEKTIAEVNPDFLIYDSAIGPVPESIKTLSDRGTISEIQTIRRKDDVYIAIYRITKN